MWNRSSGSVAILLDSGYIQCRDMRNTTSRPRAGRKRNAEDRNILTSRLRELRNERGFSQDELAQLAGMHINSIYKLEKGLSKEVSEEHAEALAAALRVRPRDLDLKIRPRAGTGARSVRFRRLTPDQRQLVDELLALPPEKYGVIREAMENVRRALKRKRRRRG